MSTATALPGTAARALSSLLPAPCHPAGWPASAPGCAGAPAGRRQRRAHALLPGDDRCGAWPSLLPTAWPACAAQWATGIHAHWTEVSTGPRTLSCAAVLLACALAEQACVQASAWTRTTRPARTTASRSGARPPGCARTAPTGAPHASFGKHASATWAALGGQAEAELGAACRVVVFWHWLAPSFGGSGDELFAIPVWPPATHCIQLGQHAPGGPCSVRAFVAHRCLWSGQWPHASLTRRCAQFYFKMDMSDPNPSKWWEPPASAALHPGRARCCAQFYFKMDMSDPNPSKWWEPPASAALHPGRARCCARC